MIFVEFSAFARRRAEHMDEEAYRELQNARLRDPALGLLVPGTGGLRKVRWSADTGGKRGGLRIIYFSIPSRALILMLALYRKGEQADITPEQKHILRRLVDAELGRRTS